MMRAIRVNVLTAWTAGMVRLSGLRKTVGARTSAAVVALSIVGLTSAHATTTGGAAPWEKPLTTFLSSLTGPVAQIVGVAAVIMCGFAIAFSEGGGGIRKLVWVALGLSIAFAATSFFLPLFGYTVGVAF